ncbi:MAG: MgtC/SapB family protein [Candidatus Kerfeldbacteria bacterium]|nr:MgtC/SapB family protein [Candidatus Kerfeldbacteria bacterium]
MTPTPETIGELTTLDIIIRIGLSLLLSGIIGLERKFYHKPAGLRTNIMVSLGATVLMLISLSAINQYDPNGVVDITRIAAQVVTGIGFLGAGAIIQGRGSIHGLTTAAGIWVVAALGMAVGLGMYTIAFIATAAALIVLVVLGRIEFRFEHRHDGDNQAPGDEPQQ